MQKRRDRIVVGLSEDFPVQLPPGSHLVKDGQYGWTAGSDGPQGGAASGAATQAGLAGQRVRLKISGGDFLRISPIIIRGACRIQAVGIEDKSAFGRPSVGLQESAEDRP